MNPASAVSGEQSKGMVQRVKDAGKSECRLVMRRIGIDFHLSEVKHIIPRESVPTSYAGPTGKGNQVPSISTAWLHRFNFWRR